MYPIINRGTWARVESYRQVLLNFLKAFGNAERRVNILSLGSGYDSTFWWLHQKNIQNICYVEVDYDRVVERKIEIIKKVQDLRDRIPDPKFPESTSDINAENYKLFSCDVRNTEELGRKLVEEY